MAILSGDITQLMGSNKIQLQIIFKESIIGSTNTVSATMRVKTRWIIEGSWNCELIVNGKSTGKVRKSIRHGDYNNEWSGYTDVLVKSEAISYTGDKSITVSAKIWDMDYSDINGGSVGYFNPSMSSTVALGYIALPKTMSENQE